jgi:hypothetical protein
MTIQCIIERGALILLFPTIPFWWLLAVAFPLRGKDFGDYTFAGWIDAWKCSWQQANFKQ